MEGITPGIVALAATALITLGLVWPRPAKSPSVHGEWAEENGWRFVERDESLARRFTGYPFEENGAATATDVLFGRYRGYLVLTYRYRPVDDVMAARPQDQGPDLRITGVVIPEDVRTLQVGRRVVRRRTPGLSVVDDGLTTDTRFESMFDVTGDPDLARAVLTPAVVEHLVTTAPRTSFRLAEGYALTWSRGETDIEASLKDADALIDLLAVLPLVVLPEAAPMPAEDSAGQPDHHAVPPPRAAA